MMRRRQNRATCSSSRCPSLVLLLTLMLLLSGCVQWCGAARQIWTSDYCNSYYNSWCNMLCAYDPRLCYAFNYQQVCPCVVKCHEDHCMTGVMAETCPECALVEQYCRPWHDHIELHSCGTKTMATREAFRLHCISVNQCVAQCPQGGQCIDPNAESPQEYWNLDAIADVINRHLLGIGGASG